MCPIVHPLSKLPPAPDLMGDLMGSEEASPSPMPSSDLLSALLWTMVVHVGLHWLIYFACYSRR